MNSWSCHQVECMNSSVSRQIHKMAALLETVKNRRWCLVEEGKLSHWVVFLRLHLALAPSCTPCLFPVHHEGNKQPLWPCCSVSPWGQKTKWLGTEPSEHVTRGKPFLCSLVFLVTARKVTNISRNWLTRRLPSYSVWSGNTTSVASLLLGPESSLILGTLRGERACMEEADFSGQAP